MISKTIGYNGVLTIFRHSHIIIPYNYPMINPIWFIIPYNYPIIFPLLIYSNMFTVSPRLRLLVFLQRCHRRDAARRPLTAQLLALLDTAGGSWVGKSGYPLVNIQKAIENCNLSLIFPLKMVIFHSYVSLTEGNSSKNGRFTIKHSDSGWVLMEFYINIGG